MVTAAETGQRRPGSPPYGDAVIDGPPTVTFATAGPPAWDPPEPRRPSLWPGAAGLVITVLVVAGSMAVLIAGLRVRYTKVADVCAAVDFSPVAAALGRSTPQVDPAHFGDECIIQLGDLNKPPVAVLTMSISLHEVAAEALASYEVTADGGGPGSVPLPGGPRGRLSTSADPFAQTCKFTAALQDVNLTMVASLEVAPATAAGACDGHDGAARALAASMRGSLAQLA